MCRPEMFFTLMSPIASSLILYSFVSTLPAPPMPKTTVDVIGSKPSSVANFSLTTVCVAPVSIANSYGPLPLILMLAKIRFSDFLNRIGAGFRRRLDDADVFRTESLERLEPGFGFGDAIFIIRIQSQIFFQLFSLFAHSFCRCPRLRSRRGDRAVPSDPVRSLASIPATPPCC